MISLVLESGFAAGIGVAIAAAVGTGVIGADINTDGTKTGWPLPRIPVQPHRHAKQGANPLLIDATGRRQTTAFLEKGIGAGIKTYPMSMGNFPQTIDASEDGVLVSMQEVNITEVAFAFRIQAQQTDSTVTGITLKLAGERGKTYHMVIRGKAGGE